MKRVERTTIVLIVLLVVYVALMTSIGRFSGFDEPWYKSAGREWATSGRFASPEITGYLQDVEPGPEDIYFAYPPIYPFLFGLLVKVIGFGWRQCVFYDSTIHALLSFLTYQIARRLGGADFSPRIALLPALAILTLGTIEGRPDEMSMCFGMAGLFPLLRTPISPLRTIGSGILFGLCAATSSGSAIMLGLIVFFLIATEPVSLTRRVGLAMLWGVLALSVLALTIAPILVPYPGAVEQYRAIARMHINTENYIRRYLWSIRFGRPNVITLFGTLIIGLWASRHGSSVRNGRSWSRLWLGPLAALAFVLVVMPTKPAYLWFISPWVLALTVVELARAWGRLASWEQVALPVLLSLTVIGGSEGFIRQSLVFATIPDNQRPGYNDRLLDTLIPEGSTVLAQDLWWLLADQNRVYDARFSCPDMETVDYIVLSGNGSRVPGKPLSISNGVCLDDYPIEEHFVPVLDHLNRQPLTLFGVRLTNSAYGFGPLVLKHIAAPHAQRERAELSREPAGTERTPGSAAATERQ